MESDLRDELLHLITYERGGSTKELFAAIEVFRLPDNNLWHHKQPVDEEDLRLLLMNLLALGHSCYRCHGKSRAGSRGFRGAPEFG